MPEEIPEVTVNAPQGTTVHQLLRDARLVASGAEASRMIEQGGVRIDGERVSDKTLRVPAGQTVVLQVGKRKFVRVTLK